MVIAAMSVLSILVTEFTYITQINQKIAFDALDQVKVHYLAKSGFKLSLLRLKAYQQVKNMMGKAGGAAPAVPRAILERIWSFPFIFPIPTSIPGLTIAEKDTIEKFQKSTNLEGNFTAVVESESSKYNLNLLLAQFVPVTTTTTTTRGAGPTTTSTGPAPAAVKFDPEQARQSLFDYLNAIFQAKVTADEEFSDLYKGFELRDLVDNIVTWADRTYESRNPGGSRDTVAPKKAPFYSLTELHMIAGMDDALYELFAPSLTVSTTPGINVNTMKEHTLRALVPGITDEEVKEFFKFRDNEDEDNQFKADTDFFNYLKTNIAAFGNRDDQITRLQESLIKRNIRIVVDETEFKITVQGQMNQSIRLIEAWVTLDTKKANQPPTPGTPLPPGTVISTTDPNFTPPKPESGLRITFMRIL
jgi:hypothetical protein